MMTVHEFISKYHGDQKYGRHPYIYHLTGVRDMYFELFFDNRGIMGSGKNQTMICYLHDVLKDTSATQDDLWKIEGMNTEVYTSVLALTRQQNQLYANYLDQIRLHHGEHTLHIKTADVLFNLKNSIKDNDNRRVQKYAKALSILYS